MNEWRVDGKLHFFAIFFANYLFVSSFFLNFTADSQRHVQIGHQQTCLLSPTVPLTIHAEPRMANLEKELLDKAERRWGK